MPLSLLPFILFNQQVDMYGKYADTRVYQHFVRTYSRVPYLDSQIFNISTRSTILEKQAQKRANTAREGLQRIKKMSDQLEQSLKHSRNKRQQNSVQLSKELQNSQKRSGQKQKLVWSNYQSQKKANKESGQKSKKYLQQLLKTNSTKAQSRRTTYRRYHY